MRSGREWVSFCYVAAPYDWRLLVRSIVRVLPVADDVLVCMPLRRLWNGRHVEGFDCPDVERLESAIWDAYPGRDEPEDSRPSVRFVFGDFWRPGFAPLVLEYEERRAMSQLVPAGGWCVQIDADEELLNPEAFAGWLRHGADPGMEQEVTWLTVWKVIGDVALVVDGHQRAPFATTGRGISRGSAGWPAHLSPGVVAHWSVGRTREELRAKLHGQPFAGWYARDPEAFLAMWDATTLENYRDRRNVCPWSPEGQEWPSLRAVSLAELGVSP